MTTPTTPTPPSPSSSASPMTEAEREALDVDMSAYPEGSMRPAERSAFEGGLAADPFVRAEYDKFKEAVGALSGLHRQPAPDKLADAVATTIHRRSAGRFFGPRRLGDRVPFELIAVLGLVLGAAVYFAMRFADDGASRGGAPADAGPRPSPGEIVPRP